MATWTRALVPVAAVAVLLAGCAGDADERELAGDIVGAIEDAVGDSVGRVGSDALDALGDDAFGEDDLPDPCGLLTEDEFEAVTGQPVEHVGWTSLSMPPAVDCQFAAAFEELPDGSLAHASADVTITVRPSDRDEWAEFVVIEQDWTDGALEPVAGIGDDAYVRPQEGEGAYESAFLHALVADVRLTVWVFGFDDGDRIAEEIGRIVADRL